MYFRHSINLIILTKNHNYCSEKEKFSKNRELEADKAITSTDSKLSQLLLVFGLVFEYLNRIKL